MSTPSEMPNAPTAREQPNLDQTKELLEFIRKENEANRKAVRDDAGETRKFFLTITKIVSIPVAAAVVVLGNL